MDLNKCNPTGDTAVMDGDKAPRAAVLEILQDAVRGQSPTQEAGNGAEIPSVYCGKSKVFLANSVLQLLEGRRAEVLNEKAFCIQCCWRRFKEKKTVKEKRSATLIQAAVRSWLAKNRFQKIRRAAGAIQRGWRRWRAKAAALAAAELDEGEAGEFPAPGATWARPPCSLDTRWPLQAVVQSWPLGLVLATAPVRVTGPRRELLSCLRGLRGSREELACGIASIRALPQGPVKFHCRRSPLHFANVSPHLEEFAMTGLNQILLDREALLPT